jgi:multimeric flavodoxin WrbA
VELIIAFSGMNGVEAVTYFEFYKTNRKGSLMPVSILAIHGSPRKNGNSIYLANRALSAAEKENALIEQVYLNDLKIKPCQGCDACRKGIEGHCVIKDDMQKLYEKILNADVLFLSSPVYWFTYSAQLKLFFDRLYAVQTETLSALKGKKIGIILTYGDVDEVSSGAINAIHTLQDAFKYTGSEILGIVYGTGGEVGAVKKNRKLVKQARDLGKKLATSH